MPWWPFALVLPAEAFVIWRVVVIGRNVSRIGEEVRHEVATQGERLRQEVENFFRSEDG